jgi:hypothetical protein
MLSEMSHEQKKYCMISYYTESKEFDHIEVENRMTEGRESAEAGGKDFYVLSYT